MIVVDASAVISALLNDGPARQLMGEQRLHVPYLIDTEVVSALRRQVLASPVGAASPQPELFHDRSVARRGRGPSVHNMIRFGSLGRETVLAPEAALTELNRLFQLDRQGDHSFTMWFGTYQVSTRTLRYANAGAPPLENLLVEGRQLSSAEFVKVCSEVADSSNRSLDDLINELRALTPTGSFEDDCSVIQLSFD